MHSEGILAGELKHGPLALVDKQMPVIMVIMKDPCFTKCQNALQQVTARQVRPLLRTKISVYLFYITRACLADCCCRCEHTLSCPLLFTFIF